MSSAKNIFIRRTKERISSPVRGFTILELIVVIGVTVFLSSIVIAYSSANRERIALTVETAKIAQLISRQRSLAISTSDLGALPLPSLPRSIARTCGYGISFLHHAVPRAYYVLTRYDDRVCKTDYGISAQQRFELDPLVDFDPSQGLLLEIAFLSPDPTVIVRREVGGRPLPLPHKILFKSIHGMTSSIEIGVGGQVTY